MKRFLCALVTMVTTAAAPAFAADVGVSVQLGEPGFYGRIDLGDAPRPQLIYPQPIVIQPAPVGVVSEPIYLRVPPGHAKNWRRYCGRYHACGQPVYFVHDRWYRNEYVRHYRERHHGGRVERRGDDRGRGHDRGQGRGRGHND